MKRFIFLFIALLVAAPMVIWAGGAEEKEEKEEAVVEEEISEGIGGVPRDELLIVVKTMGRSPFPDSFNAWQPGHFHWEGGIHAFVVRPLWLANYPKGEIVNVLAAEPAIYNEDFTKMTAKLRRGVYWSDGVEFTADDVLFTVKTLMDNPGIPFSADLNLNVDKVYKTDDFTVVFELKKPNSRFHCTLLDRWGCVRFMPKHIFEKVEDIITFNFNPPVSLGPYVLKDYDPQGFWFLWEKRKDWDRTVTGMLYGEPKPKYVLFRVYGPAEKNVMAQAKHELDLTDLTIETLRATMKKNPYVTTYRKEFPWICGDEPCLTGVLYNCERYPFNMKDVRWALVLGIDIADLIMIGFDGTLPVSAVHVPPAPVYREWYIRPMEPWLKDFTLDIEIDGKPFKPYDPTAAVRLAQRCKERGYPVPEDPEKIKEIWGLGWWKYAPEVAEKLLERNGFKRDKNGKWLLPNGKPWEIKVNCSPSPVFAGYQIAFATAQQWRKFGIEMEVAPNDAWETLSAHGDFDVSTNWPAREPWGAHPDLYRTLRLWTNDFYKPIGEPVPLTPGGASRWKDERIDRVVDELAITDFYNTTKIIELGIEGLKVAVEGMPGIPMSVWPNMIAFDEYYWTNYPSAKNPYNHPASNPPQFSFMLPFLKKTGRK